MMLFNVRASNPVKIGTIIYEIYNLNDHEVPARELS
jgi:hypothetical protein